MLTANGTRHAIATPHADATAAGAQALAAGGTAVDAAIAASAALSVVYPHMTSIGGDAIALVATPGRPATVVNGSGAAPRAVDAVVGGWRAIPQRGVHAVTVPGAVAAWEALHGLGARLSWSALLAPSVALAEQGTAVSGSLTAAIAADPTIADDDGMRAAFHPAGRPLEAGATLRQPALARTLAQIAGDGPGAFYRGEIGRDLVRFLRAGGSTMDVADLAEHATELADPIGLGWGAGERVLTAAPNSQGVVLLQALAALEQLGPHDYLGGDADLLAGILHVAAVRRDRTVADPRGGCVEVEQLLAPPAIAEIADCALMCRQGPTRVPAGMLAHASGDTVAVVAADAEGHCAVVIQSVFGAFGAKVLDPRTGILCHNRGACFSLDPAQPNAIAGGRRPMHTLMPVMVERDGALLGAHGTMGGHAQPQIHAQLLLSLREAPAHAHPTSIPRWTIGAHRPGELVIEQDVAPAAREALAAMQYPTRVVSAGSEEVGHAQVIRFAGDGSLAASSDPRADGAAVAA